MNKMDDEHPWVGSFWVRLTSPAMRPGCQRQESCRFVLLELLKRRPVVDSWRSMVSYDKGKTYMFLNVEFPEQGVAYMRLD